MTAQKDENMNQNQEVALIYEKVADWFASNRNQGLMEKEYLDLMIANIPEQGSILDLGCGTGAPIAKFFLEKGYWVTGIDASRNMVELCQKQFPAFLFPRATFQCADMRTLPNKPQNLFDAIIAWDSFFHLSASHQRGMFPLFSAYLKPGGILVFTSGPSAGEVMGEMCGYPLYHASLDAEEYQHLLSSNHFQVILHKIKDAACGDHTIWVAQDISSWK